MDATLHRILPKPDAKPVHQQSYRAGRHRRDEIEKQVNKMLKMDVIEPSYGEWAFPHLEHLREVLAFLSKAGVTLKAEKCHLFKADVEYLEHVLSSGELRVNEKNIKALRQARKPKTQTELKSFLGMCNVYRRFVRNYALISRPLTKLTSK
eukprot:contig_2284_g417